MGGWGWPNDYVCLHSGWVGVAKCLRNLKELKNGYPENTELIKAPKIACLKSKLELRILSILLKRKLMRLCNTYYSSKGRFTSD